MQNVIISGNTFNHREVLKDMGAKWDGNGRRWTAALNDASIEKLRKIVGVIVTTQGERTEAQPAKIARADDVPSFIKNGHTKIVGDDETYFNTFHHKNPVVYAGFSSLETLCDYVEQYTDEYYQRAGSTDKSFTGTYSMDDALNLARHGWQEGIDLAQEYIDLLSIDKPRIKRRDRSMSGGAVNVGRMLTGQPDHMNVKLKQDGKKFMTVYVDMVANAMTPASVMILRAANIIALIDIMENNGYSCNIVAVRSSPSNNKLYFQSAVMLKSSGETLNLSDVVFGLGHPSMLRRLGFACVTAHQECKPIWIGQGRADDAIDSDELNKNEFYIPSFFSSNVARVKRNPRAMFNLIKPQGLPVEIDFDDDES